jgi:hypothetical protein
MLTVAFMPSEIFNAAGFQDGVYLRSCFLPVGHSAPHLTDCPSIIGCNVFD